MNYCLFWLIIKSYKNCLIDRQELMRQWGNVQKLMKDRQWADFTK